MVFDPDYREPLFTKHRRKIQLADFKDANIGLEFAECRLNKIKPAPYRNKILKYVANLHIHERNGTGLILHGEYGTGKTGTAVAICVEAIMRSGRAYFISSWDLEDTFKTSIGWREQAQKCVKNMQFLILDDLGVNTKRNQDTIDHTVAMIIRERSNNRLPTLITTNLNLDALFSKYQSLQRIFVSKYIDVEIAGTDWVTQPEI